MPLRIPVVSVRYSQESNLDWSERVSCRRCGHAAKARVAAQGTGSGRAVYGIGREAARDRAGTAAFEEAVDVAKDLLRLSRCPRCRVRYGGVGSLAFKLAAFYGFLGFAVHMPIQFMLSAAETSATGCRAVGLVIWGVILSLAVSSFRRKLRTTDRRVRFEPVESLPANPRR